MAGIKFTPSAHKDLLYWEKKNPKKYERIKKLCHDSLKHPYKGIGKPEPLKYDMQGCWSRRIDHVNRLVYSVDNDKNVVVLSCRYHY